MGIINLQFFKRIGFYVSLVSIVTLLAAVFTYTYGFTGGLLEYNSSNVMTIALIGIAVFFALLVFGPTSNFAPLALWITVFTCILAYAKNIYMYFTGVFFNGVTAEAFQLIDGAVTTSIILFIISFVAGNIAMYMNHSSDY